VGCEPAAAVLESLSCVLQATVANNPKPRSKALKTMLCSPFKQTRRHIGQE
jgi:hypothetical protein